MAYIGNTPISAAFLVDTFSGNGSTVNYTMTVAPANTSSIIVAITGVVQDPSTYAVNGTTLTFSAAPPSGTSNISVRYLGIPASGVTTTAYRTVTDTTATSGQTTFTIPSYTVGFVDVFRNGVRLAAADYTATTGTTIVLVNGATVGDTITTVSFLVSSVLNAIPATAGSVGTTFLTDGSVTAAKLASGAARSNFGAGAVVQVQNTFGNTVISIANSGTGRVYSDLLTISYTPVSASNKIIVIGTAGMSAMSSASSRGAFGTVFDINGTEYDFGNYPWYDPATKYPSYPPDTTIHRSLNVPTGSAFNIKLRGYSYNESVGTMTPVFIKYQLTVFEVAA